MTAISLSVSNGRVTTTSNQIAEHFGKQHSHVLRAIRNLECSQEFNAANFGSVDYIDEKGEHRPCYTITRDGFVFLCMGFTGKQAAEWKEKYIAAFNAMEAQLSVPRNDSRIDKRAWQLAHLAYESYREQMHSCHLIERGIWTIEEWKPRLLSDELISHAKTAEAICTTYAKQFRDIGEQMRKLNDNHGDIA